MTNFPNPTVYTPLLRRLFSDERGRNLEEARQQYARVQAWQGAFAETNLTVGRRVIEEIGDIPDQAFRPLAHAMYELLELERLFELPAPYLDRMTLAEFVEYRNLLHRKEYFFANQSEILGLLHEGLVSVLSVVLELPEIEESTPFTIPLVYALPSPQACVEAMSANIVEYRERGLFLSVTEQLYRNICYASGRDPNDENSRKPLVFPTKSDLPLDELVHAYLGGTPFHDLFLAPVPLKLSHEERFNHMHVLGGTGAGKTTLIENLILHDLKGDDPPSLVVIDPHGDLIRKLTHCDLGIDPIIIDPRDTKFPVALNPFAVNRERLDHYDEATKEQVTAGVVQTFDYLFAGLFSMSLTGKQQTFFRYVTRLLLTFPETMGRNATILDMLNLIRDPVPYGDTIAKLPDIPREFFVRDFASKTFDQTRDQIRYRLQAIIENPTLARLFTATETKVDLFTELNCGSMVLVDTAKDFLKSGSSTFGRIFISLTLQAVLERAALPERERKPTFLIVDEAASYFDSNIDDLLTEARKYRCGVVLSHQYLDQASGSLRASLAANTGIKFASGLSAGDARSMAPEMRTTADFILSQPKLQFAAHIRHVTPQAVSIPIKPARNVPRLSAEEYLQLMARNQKRVSLSSMLTSQPSPPAGVQTLTPQQPEPDISREW